MPGTDGLTATRQIRGFDPAAQIVVVTDYPDEDIKAAALDAGLAPTSSSRKWTAPRSPVFAGRCGRQSLLRRSPKFHHHRSSPAGYRFHRQLTAKQFGALPHAGQAESTARRARATVRGREPHTVVFNRERHAAAFLLRPNRHRAGLRMFHDVPQRLLHNAVEVKRRSSGKNASISSSSVVIRIPEAALAVRTIPSIAFFSPRNPRFCMDPLTGTNWLTHSADDRRVFTDAR
jgi:hypothetical protein